MDYTGIYWYIPKSSSICQYIPVYTSIYTVYTGTISRGGVLAHRGGFGTFGWIDVGCWNDSESEDVTGPACPDEPDSNSKSTPAAFGISRPTRMPPAQVAIGPPARGSPSLGGQATTRGLDYPVARR
jgi:hypothetical protein